MDTNQEKTLFELVGEFHRKFGFPVAGEDGNLPHLLDDEHAQTDVAKFRRKFLLEEFNEFCSAQEEGDLLQIADALVDLVYVALGTAHYYGLPFDELFAEVQRANMDKVRVESEDDYKGRSKFDVKKPVGWKGPDLGLIIASTFFNRMLQTKPAKHTTLPTDV